MGWSVGARGEDDTPTGRPARRREVGGIEAATYIRDTKDRDGGMLCVGQPSWDSFLATVKAGRLDR
ncbi:DUF397 domain-containing protein [Saccharopolyspora sp. NPDC000359]|uniref:DUF397 domain-containing protein n=1 Tax=Saccharopolyspora sp. NPDC000359 TaxID=3154251 RepID=UPI00331E604B